MFIQILHSVNQDADRIMSDFMLKLMSYIFSLLNHLHKLSYLWLYPFGRYVLKFSLIVDAYLESFQGFI